MNKPNGRQAQISSTVGFALILLLVVLTSVVYIVASASKSATRGGTQNTIEEKPEEITLCQLTGDPGKYNRKLVRVTGFLSHGFEDSAIFDPACESRFRIWYEYGGKNSSGTMYCCGVTSERTRPKDITVENIPIPLLTDSNFQTMDRLLHKPPNAIVHATVIGRFF